MKKIIPLFILFFIISCTEKNQEYYLQHIDEAKNKNSECEEIAMKAFMSRDENKLKELESNLECKAAKKAVYKAKQEKREMERKKRKEEERLRKIQKEKEYNIALKGYKDKYNILDYTQLIPIKEECSLSFSYTKNAKCDAFKKIFEEKKVLAVNKITQEYSGQNLLDANEKWCSGIEYDEIKCSLSKIGINTQQEEKVNFYIGNRNELKKDFNNCLKEYQALRKKSKFKESTNIKKSFKCKTVRKAAEKIKIFQFSKPIE